MKKRFKVTFYTTAEEGSHWDLSTDPVKTVTDELISDTLIGLELEELTVELLK